MYRCAECGALVSIEDGIAVRSCAHDGTIIAEASVTLSGAGGVL
jgi:hypothetical protein